ncbi:MAG: FkbM family methyltransferase [Patescibacteria group bacterium]|nr:FkbM family methyltransferase [Patescibacteria group bacterium]MDE2172638.1 FkbM family methyltransferase [Patescibacteria group bacterium]
MSHRSIRKLFQKTGFDFHRHRPEPNKLAWLRALNVQTVLDVGANIGQFAREVRAVLPTAFIYSFEPLKSCFDELSRNMLTDRNFKAYNFALGAANETVTMNKSAYSPSSSILAMSKSHKDLFPQTQNSSQEEIAIKRLDDIAEFDPAKLNREILVKIDTQGFEEKVIRGATKFLKQTKVMIVENSYLPLYEGQALFDGIYQQLKALGFAYHGSLQQKVNPKSGEILFEDSFFVRD